MTGRPLTTRELNRALLARQLLAERSPWDAARAVTHLVGLQTQVPGNHYTALFSRLAGFDPRDFSRRLAEREFVRLSMQRSTIHTVTAADCLALRPVLQAAGESSFRSNWARRLPGVDLAELAARAAGLAAEQPRTLTEFGALLRERWPESEARALGAAVRHALPMVQVPPRGLWQRGGAPRHTTAQSWLGAALGTETAPDALMLRYLGAFGPASVKDAQMWSGLSRLREVFERLRPRLAVFRDEQGTELFDLPEAPRPGAQAPAPARFLPEFDNVFIGHADRTRVISDEAKSRSWSGGSRPLPVFLADGFVRGSWRIDADRGRTRATLLLTPFGPLAPAERSGLEKEGARLLGFHAPDAAHEIRFA
ncbi:winged helix DNA-binding domain-containing protein [Streptomyces hoynatensis]|uniref:Winged helix DNA-binding domain-containing protein n=1 Tax=Streptomyces hoynatensis TaxID=1141874 RepID=A0A3A9YSL0_9ACTN|nr:winged helix DNA-binding domain-containing protein [Streptomyces hoynatensis]RKN38287.1 winged helix DNA-binding domain-containing protein [Streptomyces hoynatensis]